MRLGCVAWVSTRGEGLALDSAAAAARVLRMRIPAPAKINLHLRVGPPRADGFHPLLTWMVTVGLFDTLVFVRRSMLAARRPRGRFSLSTDHPDLPIDDR